MIDIDRAAFLSAEANTSQALEDINEAEKALAAIKASKDDVFTICVDPWWNEQISLAELGVTREELTEVFLCILVMRQRAFAESKNELLKLLS